MPSREEIAAPPFIPVFSRNAAKVLPLKPNEIRRFLRKLEIQIKPDGSMGCWVWTGTKNKLGYGHMRVRGVRVTVHHFVCIAPPGLVRDHLCDNPSCVNPGHLRATTMRGNTVDRSNSVTALHARQTHCIHGHEFTEVNIRWRIQNGKKNRGCRACEKVRNEIETLARRAAKEASRG